MRKDFKKDFRQVIDLFCEALIAVSLPWVIWWGYPNPGLLAWLGLIAAVVFASLGLVRMILLVLIWCLERKLAMRRTGR